MKKLFLALLAVFSIALVVAGCGGDSKTTPHKWFDNQPLTAAIKRWC